MTKEQAVVYLRFSGFSDEQIKAIEGAFTCDKCVYSTSEGCQYDDITETIPPFEDCIRRQAVLDITWEEPSYTDAMNVLTEVRDKVKELPPVNPQKPCKDCQYKEWLEGEDLPSVNPKQKWIPVSERLPEKDKYTDFYKCMVARLYTSRSNTCDICIAYFDGKRFLSYDSHGIVSGVKAWMPLPELYDPQESEG